MLIDSTASFGSPVETSTGGQQRLNVRTPEATRRRQVNALPRPRCPMNPGLFSPDPAPSENCSLYWEVHWHLTATSLPLLVVMESDISQQPPTSQ